MTTKCMLACALLLLSTCSALGASISDALRAEVGFNSALPRVSTRQGLTGQPCNSDADCRGLRLCLEVSDGEVLSCQDSASNCFCIQRTDCTSDSDCPEGEGCDKDLQFCVATAFAGNKLNFESCSRSRECAGSRNCVIRQDGEFFDCDGQSSCFCLSLSPECETLNDCDEGESCRAIDNSLFCRESSLPGVQFNFERCFSSRDCRAPRSCIEAESGRRCSGESTCICVTDSPQCTSDSMCDRIESCTPAGDVSVCVGPSANIRPAAEENNTGAASSSEQNATPPQQLPPAATASGGNDVSSGSSSAQNEGSCSSDSDCLGGEQCRERDDGTRQCDTIEDNVCISVHHLSHLHRSELMYSKHRQAPVLCDASSSCATAGHIVVYEGKPMMMSSYCKQVACVQKIMKVNNPRYAAGKVVPSHSENMYFTTFAARYNSRIEEHVLRVVVRLGL